MICWLKFRRLFGATILGCLLASSVVHGAPPSVESVAPMVLERGQTTEVSIVGAGLEQCRSLVFYDESLRCINLRTVDEYTLVAEIAVSRDCSVDNYPFRLLGTDGFSELRTLKVSPLPVVREAPRTSVEAALALPQRNLCVWGVLEDGDYDRYQLQLQQGARYTVEVEAMRLGGVLLDTVLTITDPTGKVVAANDDGSLLRQDPSLSFVADSSGSYVIEVRETNYGGDSNSQYALYVGDFPLAEVCYPAGGQAGTELEVQFLSVDGTSDLRQLIALPELNKRFELFAADERGRAVSATPFRVSSFPNVLEAEPNNGWSQNDGASSLPVALNGILQAAGDIDYFAVQADAGQSLVVEVFAQRNGSPIDTLLQISDDTGRELARNDDWGSQDSRIEFRVPESGVYRVAVTDKLGRGSRQGVYRVEIDTLQPQLEAFIPRPNRTSQRAQTIAVPQGNRTLARIGVRRENMPSGVVQLQFDGLPDGVHASPVYVPEDQFWALAILEADTDVELSGHLARLVASGQAGAQTVKGELVQVVDLIAESADRLYQSSTVDRVAVAVTPALPFRLELEQPQAGLAAGGTLDLKVRLQREEGFSGPVEIEFPFLPDGCVGAPRVVIEAGQAETLYRLDATPEVARGDFRLVAVGKVALASGRDRDAMSAGASAGRSAPVGPASQVKELFALADREVASQLIDLRIGDSPVSGSFVGLAAEQGATLRVTCQLQIEGQVPASWECSLEGLPTRVAASTVRSSASARSVEFDVQVPSDVPVGRYRGVQCRLTGELAGSPVSFVVPADAEMLIAEPGKLFRSPDGRLLSPLEALRAQNAH